jgi:hypothetical protein
MKGWRYEGYRHSLAAKGMSTRTSFSGKQPFITSLSDEGKKDRILRHIFVSEADNKKIDEARDYLDDEQQNMLMKAYNRGLIGGVELHVDRDAAELYGKSFYNLSEDEKKKVFGKFVNELTKSSGMR